MDYSINFLIKGVLTSPYERTSGSMLLHFSKMNPSSIPAFTALWNYGTETINQRHCNTGKQRVFRHALASSFSHDGEIDKAKDMAQKWATRRVHTHTQRSIEKTHHNGN